MRGFISLNERIGGASSRLGVAEVGSLLGLVADEQHDCASSFDVSGPPTAIVHFGSADSIRWLDFGASQGLVAS